jgi:hypothetical protein
MALTPLCAVQVCSTTCLHVTATDIGMIRAGKSISVLCSVYGKKQEPENYIYTYYIHMSALCLGKRNAEKFGVRAIGRKIR